MFPNFLISGLSLLGFFAFFFGLFLLKKTDSKLNAVIWLPINFMLSFSAVAFMCGIVNLILPITLVTVALISLLAAVPLWYFIIKKGRQEYSLSYFDVCALFVLIGIAGFFAFKQFGGLLIPVYETSDPGVHLRLAMDVLNSNKISGMYFAPLFNAMMIEMCSAFVSVNDYYKIFILCDIAMLVLSAMLFYSLLSKRSEKLKYKICALFITVAYMIGFPLNNMVFGFVYLGIGVSVIVTIIFFAEHYAAGDLHHWFTISALMLLCNAIALCYSLFAPMTFFGVLFVSAFVFIRDKKLFTLGFVIEQLKIFLIPCIMAVYYIAFTGSKGFTQTSSLAIEGYIYRELYSDFILVIPPALFAAYRTFVKKRIEPVSVLFVIMGVLIAVVLVLGLKGYFSSYYYFKFYYPFAAICAYMTFLAVRELGEENLSFVATSFVCYALLFTVMVSELDVEIQKRNILFNPSNASYDLFDVYSFNSQKIIRSDNIEKRTIWNKKKEIFDYVINNCSPEEKEVQFGDAVDGVYWYEAVTNQRLENYYWHDSEAVIEDIESASFVAVTYGSEMYKENQALFDSFEKVFENDIGFVSKIG